MARGGGMPLNVSAWSRDDYEDRVPLPGGGVGNINDPGDPFPGDPGHGDFEDSPGDVPGGESNTVGIVGVNAKEPGRCNF